MRALARSRAQLKVRRLRLAVRGLRIRLEEQCEHGAGGLREGLGVRRERIDRGEEAEEVVYLFQDDALLQLVDAGVDVLR